MSVNASTAFSGPFTPNSATVAFPFAFPCLSVADVVVLQNDAALTTGFVITLNSDQLDNPGGVVTFTTAPVTGSGTIYVYSQPLLTQQVAHEIGVPWNAATVVGQNSVNDRLTVIAQAMGRDIGRALLAPLGNSSPPAINLTGMVDGQAIGMASGVLVPVANSAADASAQASVATTQAAIATSKAAISTAEAVIATAAAATASTYGPQAVSASLASNVYPAAYASALPQGMTGYTSLVGGSGGTTGTYALGISGGPTGCAGTYTIAGGAVTSITITNPGLSTSSTAPTLSFPSGSVTGASATAVVGTLIANQKTYWVPSSDGTQLLLYGNNAGSVASAPFGGSQTNIPANVQYLIGQTSRADGPGASLSGTGATDQNTWLFPPLDCDCFLDGLDLNCIATGVGNLRFGLAGVNLDGTNYQYQDFGPVVWSSTGVQTFAYGGYQAKKGMRPFIRRMASNAGQFAYTGASLNSGLIDYYSGDLNAGAGNVTISTNSVSIPHKLHYREVVKVTDVRAAHGQTLAVVGNNDGGVGNQQRAYLSTGLVPGTSASTNSVAYTGAKPIPNGGPLNAYWAYAVAAGFYTMHVFAPTDSAYVQGQCILQATKYISGAGWFAFTGGTDYDIRFVPRGTRIAISSAGSGVYYSYNINGKGAYGYTLPVRVGDIVTPVLATNLSIMCYPVIGAPAITLHDKIRLNDEFVRGSMLMHMQMFAGTSIPSNWTLTGWTVNNGLVSPSSGSATITALYSGTYNPTHFSTSIDFTVNAASTAIKFGLCASQTYSGALIVNLVTMALELYNYNGTTLSSVYASQAIGFATGMGSTTGRTYSLTVKRAGFRFQAVLTDKATGETVILATNTRGVQGQRMKGPQGLMFLAGSGSAGDITVNRFTTAIGVNKTAKIAFVGHSITEGAKQTDEDPRSWAEIIVGKRNHGDAVIFATEGINAAQTNAYLASALAPLTSLQYVVLDCGTNDGSQSTWRTQMAAMIATVVAAGAMPVLCAPAPRAGYPTAAMCVDIRTGYFGGYPYIDLGAAVSLDDVNWYANMLLSDNIHPTTLGAAAMAARALIDAPYLLDGCYAGQIPVTD